MAQSFSCVPLQLGDSVLGLNHIGVAETTLFYESALVDVCLDIRNSVIAFL